MTTIQGIQSITGASTITTTGANYCVEALSLFTRMDVQPTSGLKILINKTIIDLKEAGIWDITDKFNKWDLHTEQASLLDWKNATFNATNEGATQVVFTPKVGLETTTSVNYIDLHFNAANDCLYGTQDNLAFSLDDLAGTPTPGFNFGGYMTVSEGVFSYIMFRTKESNNSPRPWLYINSGLQRVFNGQAGIKLWYNERPSNDHIILWNSPTNSMFGTPNASTALCNNGLVLGAIRYQNQSLLKNYIKTSTFWLGSAFTATQRAAWYDIITYWKANIGATF